MKIDKNITCPHCGNTVDIPKKIVDAAKHWQNELDTEAKRKRTKRQANKKYCQKEKSRDRRLK
jgi:Fe2+ or Zn2+ uptake regulation protein